MNRPSKKRPVRDASTPVLSSCFLLDTCADPKGGEGAGGPDPPS